MSKTDSSKHKTFDDITEICFDEHSEAARQIARKGTGEWEKEQVKEGD